MSTCVSIVPTHGSTHVNITTPYLWSHKCEQKFHWL